MRIGNQIHQLSYAHGMSRIGYGTEAKQVREEYRRKEVRRPDPKDSHSQGCHSSTECSGFLTDEGECIPLKGSISGGFDLQGIIDRANDGTKVFRPQEIESRRR